MYGISKSAPSILNLTKLILRYVRSKQYKKVIILGASSSGGFGALLYGNLISVDYMIAFNPQTTLDVDKDTTIKDDIFAVYTLKLLIDANNCDQFHRKCLKLRNFIPFAGQAVSLFKLFAWWT